MKRQLKALAARLPRHLQQELKRRYFRSQIRRNAFRSDEAEFALLPQLVGPGNWVLDIGANIGHYTARFSQLVGPTGRVIAFEPVPATFELLAANMALMPARNVTLINAAASSAASILGISIPQFEHHLDNYYMAHVASGPSDLQVFGVRIDSFGLPPGIRLVKIDAENHEMSVLQGMVELLQRDRPTLIVEDNQEAVRQFLAELGYGSEKLAGSSNRIFRAP